MPVLPALTSSSRVRDRLPAASADSVVLEEELGEPTDSEMQEYAVWLGMTLPEDEGLLWICREALLTPLPAHWKPCRVVGSEDIYYFNFVYFWSKFC